MATCMHKHGGACHIVDSSTIKQERGAWPSDLQAKLHACNNVLGLDMEWVPDRCPQHNHKVALLQLAVGDVVWLIRTCHIKLPAVVRDVLLDKSVIKVVANFDSADKHKLLTSFNLVVEADAQANGFLDIGKLAQECGFPGYGVKKLCERYGYRIEKNRKMSMSNWEASELSLEQQQYAADDAYFSLLMAMKLFQEDTIQNDMPAFRQEAWSRLAAQECKLLNGLKIEDSSERDAAHRAFWEQLCEAVLKSCEFSGQSALPLNSLGRLQHSTGVSFSKLSNDLGIGLNKKILMEQRAYFATTGKQDQIMVRARIFKESGPPSMEETTLDWISDRHEALERWLDIQSAKALDEVQVVGRLRDLGRWFESEGRLDTAKFVSSIIKESNGSSIRDAVVRHSKASPDGLDDESKAYCRASLQGAEATEASLAKKQPDFDSKNHFEFDPERSVTFRGVPFHWTEDDFVRAVAALVGSADALADWKLLPARKGKGQRKAFAMFVGSVVANELLSRGEVCHAGASFKVERASSSS